MPLKTNRLARYVCLAIFLMLNCSLLAQKTVTGKVTNNTDKQPIAGASVQVKGTKTVTTSETDGTFRIAVPANNSVLQISVVGFDKIEIPVSGRNDLGEISLIASPTTLNDVVVTGYSAQRKKDITGSVAVVNINNMKSVPSGTTESLLQGQASGVTVINTGAPGGPSNVRIRGITSAGSSDPLVIIDGTPGNMHDINVNDVQSIQVLKDAGAAAIYGVRGSNGVIIITTKKGRAGRVQINYDGFVGTQRPLKNGFNIANPTETANAIWQEYENDSLVPFHKQYGGGPTPVIPDYITPAGAKEGDPNTDPSTYALYTNQITKANKAGTDWFHEIFKPAPIQSHNISASGGGEKSSYFLSFNYFDQQGTLIYTYLKRYSVRINTTFSLADDHIRFGENAYVFYKQNPGYLNLPGVNNANSINASYREQPIVPVFDIKGNFAGTGSQSLGNSPQPVAIQARTANNSGNDWQINGNLFAEVDFLKHFTLRTSIGGTVDNFYNNAFVFTSYENAENATNPNSYQENYGWASSRTWTNTLKYANVFGGKHNVNVLIGTEAISNNARAVGASRGGYYITNPNNLTVDPNLWTLNFGQPAGQTNSNIAYNGTQTPYQLSIYSLFGRVDYNFNDKYLLSGTLRRDGSSVFSENKRYGVFPSVTAGWRISRESFMKDVAWLNDLKIRGGWGKLGSISNINPTNAYTLYGQAANLSYYDVNGNGTNPTQGLYLSQYGNTSTTWEEDIVTNIGFDATLFNNKLDFTFEWYKKSISGLLNVPVVPATNGGALVPFINIGDIQNTGIDAAVTYHGSIQRDFKFDVTLNFTSYNNKVVSLPPGTLYYDYGQTRLQAGHPVSAFFGYKVLGIFQTKDEVSKAPAQDGAAPGRFRYQDVNNDNKIDANDRTFFGNPNPAWSAGLNVGASFKNFDFFIFLYASVGNDVLNMVRTSTDFPQQFDAAMSKDVALHSWRPDRPNSKIPMLERQATFSNALAFNSYFDENGSFLRCKTLTFGYTIPNTGLQRLRIDKLRIYAQVLNLFTVTKYTGLDPELPGNNTRFGLDGGAYPNNQKTYSIGVNLSFH